MTAIKVKQYLLPNLPYAFLFWIFGKCGEAYRQSAGNDVLQKLLGTISGFNAVMSHPMLSFEPFDLLIGLVGAMVVYLIVYNKKKNAKKFRKNREYGSACWGSSDDIKPYVDPKPDNNIILTATESLTLNGRPKNPKHARNKNVLIVGGSGSGKTRFWLKPNLILNENLFIDAEHKRVELEEYGTSVRYDNDALIAVIRWIVDNELPKEIYGYDRTFYVEYEDISC